MLGELLKDQDSGWRLQPTMMLRGRWGHLGLVADADQRWRFVCHLGSGADHRTYASYERWEELPEAMTAVELHAESEGLRHGAWEMGCYMVRLRVVGEQCWVALLHRLPDTWALTHIVTVPPASDPLRELLAHHVHQDVQRFDDWPEAVAYSDAWHPPELQTLCSCAGGR